MTDRMLAFVELGAHMPDKRGQEIRSADFDEIYAEYTDPGAARQAARCSQCGVPSCQTHCPLHNNIPDWLKLAAEGRLEEAYELSQATNTFPEICGRICPQDRLCEGNCVIEKSGHGSVTIGAIERYITETAWEKGWVKPSRPTFERPESVGIVGAGPAGLAAADWLRRRGYSVTVYDRHDRAGGLMTYGIPNFKLDKAAVFRRVEQIEAGGVRIELNCEIGPDLPLGVLRARHDAVLLAVGTYRSRCLGAPGSGLGGIVSGLDYLVASNRKGLGDAVPCFDSGELDARGRDVVVVGGGDTAMDCVRTALRQGAHSVSCLYRRDRANMPGSRREVANAEEEGVAFRWLSAPQAFRGEETVRAVLATRMRLGAPDDTGRRAPEEVKGSTFDLPAGLVVEALGFDPENFADLWGEDVPELTGWGTVRADPRTGATSEEGVYAAGDVVRGASLVVWAIRDGRDAAAAIHARLAAAQERLAA